MKKYNNYKHSGIEWIGEIPKHWEVTRLGFLASKIGDGLHGTPSYVDNSNFKFINGNNIGDGQICIYEHTKCVSEEEYLSNKKELNENSILMSINGTIGNLGFYKGEKVMLGKSVAYINIIDSNVLNFTYKYLESESCKTYIDNQLSGSTIKNLSLYSINKIPIPFPSIEEQTQIAYYLDHKANQIDTLITKKEQFITLLQEERTAVINEAVTKGLDPKVKMKNSSIEWLGEIPKHWEVILFKRVIARIKDGTHGTFQRLPEGYPFLSAKNVYNDGLKISETESLISEKDFIEITKNGFPKKNDLLITCVGTIGRTFVYDKEESIAFQRSVTFIRFNENMNPHYYKFYVQSSIYQNLLISLAKTSAQSGIYMNDLMNTYALKVPLNEQTKIAEFLKTKTSEIDKIILKAQQEIELLKEYKTALISEVITGKVDVRNVILN